MIPLYAFLEGDCLGLLILAEPDDTAAELAEKVQSAASVRVARRASLAVVHQGLTLAPSLRLKAAGIRALDRVDVVLGREP